MMTTLYDDRSALTAHRQINMLNRARSYMYVLVTYIFDF